MPISFVKRKQEAHTWCDCLNTGVCFLFANKKKGSFVKPDAPIQKKNLGDRNPEKLLEGGPNLRIPNQLHCDGRLAHTPAARARQWASE
jgi:hypothetical protein